jgi:hypothetical protein
MAYCNLANGQEACNLNRWEYVQVWACGIANMRKFSEITHVGWTWRGEACEDTDPRERSRVTVVHSLFCSRLTEMGTAILNYPGKPPSGAWEFLHSLLPRFIPYIWFDTLDDRSRIRENRLMIIINSIAYETRRFSVTFTRALQ